VTKNGRQFLEEKNMLTPSVAAPGDTNPNDATAIMHGDLDIWPV